MSAYDCDLFVIGLGSGGVRAARIAARHGARVVAAEERYLGGTCVNVGCIPKKLLVLGGHFREDVEDAAGFGWTVGDVAFDWATLIRNKNKEIERLNGVYGRLLEGAGVKVVRGRARLLDAHTVAVGDERWRAERILVAVGGWPAVPAVPGCEHAVTSNEVFFLEQLPRRVLIVGGGYIAVEFAGVFKNLGAEVTQLYRGPLFLRGFDDDVREHLAETYVRKGIDLRFSTDVAAIAPCERDGRSAYVVDLTDKSSLEVDLVLYATGRAPLTADLGLAEAGVALDEKGAVVVDEEYRTSVPHIYAIGDVIDRIKLTPVAVNEGHILADRLFNRSNRKMSYDNVPSAVFSMPSIGTVGLTEREARARLGDVHIYRTSFRGLKATLSGREETTLMKLVVDPGTDRVIGVHMVGPDAGETIQGFAVALTAGATKADFDRTVGIHPTAAEEFVTMRERYIREAVPE